MNCYFVWVYCLDFAYRYKSLDFKINDEVKTQTKGQHLSCVKLDKLKYTDIIPYSEGAIRCWLVRLAPELLINGAALGLNSVS